MDKPIKTQTVEVSRAQGANGSLAFVYSTRRSGTPEEEGLAEQALDEKRVAACVEDLEKRVADLFQMDCAGEPRDETGFDPVPRELSCLVLPPPGLLALVGPDTHPRFSCCPFCDTLPWELVETKKEVEADSVNMALACHLTHTLPLGEDPPDRPADQILFVVNPGMNLCETPGRDDGSCATHAHRLRGLCEKQGFRARFLSGADATRDNVMAAMGKPGIYAIYFFGEARMPLSGESVLLLADQPLTVRDIRSARPAARVVVINACEPGPERTGHGVFMYPRPLAQAFGECGASAVIAPTLALSSNSAAMAAVSLVHNATSTTPLAAALRAMRRKSFGKYQEGFADYRWAAYRYFGDPNIRLAAEEEREEEGMAGEVERVEE